MLFNLDLSGLGAAVTNSLQGLTPLFLIVGGLIVASAILAWGVEMLQSWRGDGEEYAQDYDPEEDWYVYTVAEGAMYARRQAGEIDDEEWNNFVHGGAGEVIDRMEAAGWSRGRMRDFFASKGSRLARQFEE